MQNLPETGSGYSPESLAEDYRPNMACRVVARSIAGLSDQLFAQQVTAGPIWDWDQPKPPPPAVKGADTSLPVGMATWKDATTITVSAAIRDGAVLLSVKASIFVIAMCIRELPESQRYTGAQPQSNAIMVHVV